MSESTAGYAVAVEAQEGCRALAGQLALAAEDRSVSICALTGRGRAFSAGVDLNVASHPEGGDELGAQFDLLLEALAGFPEPLVAAVNRPAVGFGATMLLHCDLVVVDETVTIRLPFVQLGTCAEAGSSWLLPLRVGAQHASWMLLSGASNSPDDAISTGLAFARCRAGGSLDRAVALAHQLAANQLDVLVANTRLLRQGFAEHIGAAWQREKVAMAAVAETVGPIAWPDTGAGAASRRPRR